MTYREYMAEQYGLRDAFQSGELTRPEWSRLSSELQIRYAGRPLSTIPPRDLKKAQRLLDAMTGRKQ